MAGLLLLPVIWLFYSFEEAVKTALIFEITAISIAILGFFIEEWFMRWRKWKKLIRSSQYKEFFREGFKINEDLELEGILNGYFIQFNWNKKPVGRNKYENKYYAKIYCIPENFDDLHAIFLILLTMWNYWAGTTAFCSLFLKIMWGPTYPLYI